MMEEICLKFSGSLMIIPDLFFEWMEPEPVGRGTIKPTTFLRLWSELVAKTTGSSSLIKNKQKNGESQNSIKDYSS